MHIGSVLESRCKVHTEIYVIVYNSKRSGKTPIPNPRFESKAANFQPLTLEHFWDLAHLQSTAPQPDSAVFS